MCVIPANGERGSQRKLACLWIAQPLLDLVKQWINTVFADTLPKVGFASAEASEDVSKATPLICELGTGGNRVVYTGHDAGILEAWAPS